jgi:hypothetical protein
MYQSYRPHFNEKHGLNTHIPNKKTHKTTKNIHNIIVNNKTKKSLTTTTIFIDPNTNIQYNLNIPEDKQIIQKIMLANLKNNKYVSSHNIIFPKQCSSNCWFNVLFCIHFLSDKGRLFTKPIRMNIINENYDQTLLSHTDKKLFAKSLMLLNIAIEASLTGSPIAKYMNTNEIISGIYDSFITKSRWMKNIGDFGNSIEYFLKFIRFIYPSDIIYFDINLYHNIHITNSFKNKYIIADVLPHICYLEINDSTSITLHNKKNFITIKSTINGDTANYILDAICIRDIKQQHVGCLITLDKTGFFFDGASNLKKRQLNWKTNKFINSNHTFSIANNTAKFNLRRGYQTLYFYRT